MLTMRREGAERDQPRAEKENSMDIDGQYSIDHKIMIP